MPEERDSNGKKAELKHRKRIRNSPRDLNISNEGRRANIGPRGSAFFIGPLPPPSHPQSFRLLAQRYTRFIIIQLDRFNESCLTPELINSFEALIEDTLHFPVNDPIRGRGSEKCHLRLKRIVIEWTRFQVCFKTDFNSFYDNSYTLSRFPIHVIDLHNKFFFFFWSSDKFTNTKYEGNNIRR